MDSNSQLLSNIEKDKEKPQEQKKDSSFSITTFVWRFFSVISWIFLVASSYEAYIHNTTLYTVHSRIYEVIEISGYIPISIRLNLLQTFYLIILFFGFFNYMYFGVYKKDEFILKPMFGKFSTFHFIPLFFVSLINIIIQDSYYLVVKDRILDHLITVLVFDIIAFISLFFIYIKTDIKHDWFIVLTIKKGVYSFLLVMLWHNFFYLIILIKSIKKYDDGLTELLDFLKDSGISFSIIIGFGSMIFSFGFKDLIAAVTNFLMYAGMVNSFFGCNGKSERQKELSGGVTDGVLQIIMMTINLSFILFLINKYKNELVRNKLSFRLDTYY